MEPSFSESVINETRKLPLKSFPKYQKQQSEEENYWKNFKFPVLNVCSGAINSIEFSEVFPHEYAISSSSTVQIFDPVINKAKKNLTRFKDTVQCASYRKDGRLLLVGGKEKKIRLIDLSTKSFLQTFYGHTDSVTTNKFRSDDNAKMYSSSLDCSVRLWDTSGGPPIAQFTEHKDQVRVCAEVPGNTAVIASGSYDHTVKLWDTRINSSVMSFDQEDPVEDILLFPHGGALIAAGSNKITVWDLIAGKKFLTFSNHQKTITTLAFDGNKKHLLSGSIDRHIKIYDLESYRVTYSIKYPSPVLSVALSPNNSHFVVGMSDGVVSIKTYKKKAVISESSSSEGFFVNNSNRQPNPGTYRYFMRGKTHKPNPNDFLVPKQKRKHLLLYEKYIRKYRYKDALDAVLASSNNPVIVISILEELQKRNGLEKAIMGRSENDLKPLLYFLTKHFLNPLYFQSLFTVASLILDMYGGVVGQSPDIFDLLQTMQEKIRIEIEVQKQLFNVLGCLDLIISTSVLAKQDPISILNASNEENSSSIVIKNNNNNENASSE